MDSASNELHLTPENIRDIQELVLLITPDFREELWERVSLDQAREREKQEATVAAMQQMMNTTALFNQLLKNGTGTLGQTPPGRVTRRAFVPQSVPIYQSVGTGFTPYGPLSQEMGLTLSKPVEDAIDTLDKWSNFPP